MYPVDVLFSINTFVLFSYNLQRALLNAKIDFNL